MRSMRFVAAALLLVTTAGGSLPVNARQVSNPPAHPFTLPSNLLDLIPYDAAQRGPLLLIGEARIRWGGPNEGQGDIQTLFALAEGLGRKVVPIGSLTVLAPPTMRVIVDNPGKPDVYAGLRAEERFKILLSQFSTAQWELAGSARGIGPADMSETQRGLYVGLLPEKMRLQRIKLVPTDKPSQNRYEYQGDAQNFDVGTARLRLVRKVNFSFSKPGTDDTAAESGILPDAGDETTIFTTGAQARGDDQPDADAVKAYGVPIIQTLPNRLKPGMLNFASAFLQTPVALGSPPKTLGELLARVAQATRLDLVADKRIANLPVYMRAARGQTARAGDILQALCWSVTGAFRRISTSTYLLTDDAHGIGTRWARLDEWAETAWQARNTVMSDVIKSAARHDPLKYVGFAPGDPHSLPPALQQRVDDSYRNSLYNGAPVFKSSELPAALQQAIQHDAEFWEDNHITIRTDRVRVGTELSAQFVIGNGMAVEAPFAQRIGAGYLQEIAASERSTVPSGAAPSAPLPLPAVQTRRVLIAPMPQDNKALTELIQVARAKGFGEVWLCAPLDRAETPALLQSAVAAGKQARVAVGAAVSLLHDGGIGGTEDVNILGESGAQYAKRSLAAASKDPDPYMAAYYKRMAGWTIMDGAEAARRASALARVTGLSALALRATAAPGWVSDTEGGDGLLPNAQMGYGTALRLAHVKAEGIDPLDVAPHSYRLGNRPDLPFFPSQSDDLWKALNLFRAKQNERAMAAIYRSLKQAAPNLPLYTDDRVSSYTDPNTSWYARWDAPDRLPINPVYSVESGARAAAFARSSEPLLRLNRWSGKTDGVAREFGEAAQIAAKHWRGVTLDLATLTPAEAIRILNALPDCPPPIP